MKSHRSDVSGVFCVGGGAGFFWGEVGGGISKLHVSNNHGFENGPFGD